MTRATQLSDDLVELRFDSQAAAESAAAKLRRDGGWLEVVTGIDTVTVQFDCMQLAADAALQRLGDASEAPPLDSETIDAIDIPVCYASEMAPDLESVCAHLGLTTDEFIRRHTADDHRLRLLGFAPGFAYLDGLDPSLDVPRHAQPRQQVPAGSIAIAGGQTGIYSLASPGGWQIVGRTPIALFDVTKSPPMRLVAGQRIRFHAISAQDFDSLVTQ